MNYEQKYIAALEWMRDVYPTLTGATKEDAEHFFPELSESEFESEDERTRREILDFIQLCLSRTDFGSRSIALRKEDAKMFEKWITHLEKQKEQKPNIELIQRAWYMEGYYDGKFKREPMWIVKTGAGGPKYENNGRYGQLLVDEQKPAEWSEEGKGTKDGFIKFIQRLKSSLRPQHHWKPGEEQMNALKNIAYGSYQIGDGPVLRELYDNLKKL